MNRLQICSKEVSLLARELGYSWKEDYPYYYTDYTKESVTLNPFLLDLHEIPILAPQQELLKKWLRDVKKYFIIIRPKIKDFTEQTFGWENNFNFDKKDFPLFDTYENALEDGLLNCLKIIKQKEIDGNKTK